MSVQCHEVFVNFGLIDCQTPRIVKKDGFLYRYEGENRKNNLLVQLQIEIRIRRECSYSCTLIIKHFRSSQCVFFNLAQLHLSLKISWMIIGFIQYVFSDKRKLQRINQINIYCRTLKQVFFKGISFVRKYFVHRKRENSVAEKKCV